MITDAMVIEFRAVDFDRKNKEGKPYRIENTIDIQHELMPSPNAGHQVVKVKVVPPNAKLLFTTDNTTPPTTASPTRSRVSSRGRRDGASVCRKGRSRSRKPSRFPRHWEGWRRGGHRLIRLPATVNGRAFPPGHSFRDLPVPRSLPDDARLQKVQAKVTLAATDNTVTLTWDGKTRLAPTRCVKPLSSSTSRVEDGEWWLGSTSCISPPASRLLQWQVDTSTKIEIGQVTQ